jgi:hypothetical protein
LEQSKQTLDTWVAAGVITTAQAAELANKFTYLTGAVNDLDGRKVLIEVITQWRQEGVRPGAVNAELQGRAHGGPVNRGESYIVGDRRGMDTAEVFTPSQDGYIHPNAGGAGGGGVPPVFVYIGGDQVAATVTRQARADARGRRN